MNYCTILALAVHSLFIFNMSQIIAVVRSNSLNGWFENKIKLLLLKDN